MPIINIGGKSEFYFKTYGLAFLLYQNQLTFHYLIQIDTTVLKENFYICVKTFENIFFLYNGRPCEEFLKSNSI